MRRLALIGLVLCLPGCAYQTWYNLPLTQGTSPNIPPTDAPNIHQVLGHTVEQDPISAEPGDIWPGPLPEMPTVSDLEADSGLTPQRELPVPGSPLSRELGPDPYMPQSSAPDSANPPASSAPVPAYAKPAAAPPPPNASGHVVQTSSGTAVTTGGTPGYNTAIAPGGGQMIMVPNGNGTSTVIHPDGRIETVPTPKQ
jgi:hypothetical protein